MLAPATDVGSGLLFCSASVRVFCSPILRSTRSDAASSSLIRITDEIQFVIDYSDASLAVTIESRLRDLEGVSRRLNRPLPIVTLVHKLQIFRVRPAQGSPRHRFQECEEGAEQIHGRIGAAACMWPINRRPPSSRGARKLWIGSCLWAAITCRAPMRKISALSMCGTNEPPFTWRTPTASLLRGSEWPWSPPGQGSPTP